MGDFWIIRVVPQCDACENLQKVRVFSKIIFPIKILFFQNSQNYRGDFSKSSWNQEFNTESVITGQFLIQ